MNLEVIGFCSIQSLSIILESNGIHLIKGPNGAGKSTFLNAISWCIYGKTLKNVKDVNTLPSWQPKEYKGTLVKLSFEKQGSIHQIIRCQNYSGKVEEAKGASRLIYLIDGVQVKEKSKPKIQELIEKDLGSSFRLFKNTITFGQRLQRIAEESGPDKKALFEEAFEIGYITIAKNIATQMKREAQTKYEQVHYKLKSLVDSYEEVKKSYTQIRENEKNYKKLFRQQVQKIENQIKLRHEKLVSLEKKLDKNLLTKNSKKLDQLKRELKVLNKSELELNQKTSTYSSKKGILALVQSTIDLMKEKQYIKAYSSLILLQGQFIALEKIKESKSSLREKIESLEEICSEQNDIREDLTTIKGEITSLIKEKGNLRLEKISVLSPQYKERRTKIKKELKKNQEKYELQKKTLENLNWVISDPLSNSGMKTFIFDSSLEALNDCLYSYSTTIGFNIKFTVDSQSTKRDFITIIEKDGQILQYEELSGGEQQLVNVAMAFALHSITSATLGINLLFLDELFENLDKSNIEIVMDLVKYIGNGKSIYVITHQENFSVSGANTIKVKKDNGITTIIP